MPIQRAERPESEQPRAQNQNQRSKKVKNMILMTIPKRRTKQLEREPRPNLRSKKGKNPNLRAERLECEQPRPKQ